MGVAAGQSVQGCHQMVVGPVAEDLVVDCFYELDGAAGEVGAAPGGAQALDAGVDTVGGSDQEPSFLEGAHHLGGHHLVGAGVVGQFPLGWWAVV